MKTKKVSKLSKYLFASFAFALIFTAMAPELQVHAAIKSDVVETRYILGDGVRLRKEGWLGGTILELMYNGEEIRYFPEIFGSDTEYNYMQRMKTKTYGYVDHHYTYLY